MGVSPISLLRPSVLRLPPSAPMPSATFEISDGFFEALRVYKENYRRVIDWADVVNRAMALWVSFAMNKTKEADGEAILALLKGPLPRPKNRVKSTQVPERAQVTTKRKKARRTREPKNIDWKNTYAAHIAYARNYKGIRNATPGRAYALIARMVRARTNSVGYHKFGFVPALRRLKSNAISPGQFRGGGRFTANRPPGTVQPADNADSVPVAIVTNFARGIFEVSPHVFKDSEPEVIAQLLKYARENIAQAHQRAFKK